MHFQCQNYQMFGKIAEHTAKTNVLLITETQISMPNLCSDECTAQVRPEPSARKPFRCITARHNFEVFCHSNIYKQTFPQARTLLDLMSLPRVSKTLITQPMQWMGTSTHSGRVSRTTKGPGSSLTWRHHTLLKRLNWLKIKSGISYYCIFEVVNQKSFGQNRKRGF